MAWSLFGGNRKRKNQKTRHQSSHRGFRTAKGRLNRFERLEDRHMLAVLTVNTISDTTAADAVLTLREALTVVNSGSTVGLSAQELAQVNATASALGINDTIQFDSTVFAAAQTIALAAPGQLPIQQSVSILGTGSDKLTITAAAASRIFQIDAGDVLLKGVTLTGGAPAAGNGGAINSDTLGTLMINNSVIRGSTAVLGGGIYATGDLVLTSTTIGGTGAGDPNTATTNGGGIYDLGGMVTLKNSNVIGNFATAGAGGGIFNNTTVNLQTSIVNANTSGAAGGGIAGQNVISQNTLIASNTAGTRGGGVDATTFVGTGSTILGNTANTSTGGGIDANTTVLKNSTVSGNTATIGNGGGVNGTTVQLQNSTISDNQAGPAANSGGIRATSVLTVQNSIIAKNSALTFPDVFVPGAATVRFSLIQDFSGNVPGGAGTQFEVLGTTQNAFGNFIGTPGTPITNAQALGAGTGTVAPNGGPTPTIDITGSIVINKGSNALAVSPSQGDQRGLPFARISPLGGVVDMGAFEVQTATAGNNPPTLVAPITSPQTATVGVAYNLSVTGNFTDLNGDPLTYAAEQLIGGLPAALPSWLSFNSATGQFSGIPTAADVGSVIIRVTATDNKSVPPPPLPTTTFTLIVNAAPVIPPVAAELPFNESFEGVVPAGQIAPDPRIKEKAPAFATTTTGPLNGTTSLQATRPTVGSRPVATVDFVNPATPPAITNVAVNVSTGGGNGSTLWNNAVIVFDYQSPTNYKFAGVFQIVKKLIIGQVVNGRVTYLAQKAFNAPANTLIPLNLAINQVTKQVTLSSGATSVQRTFGSIGTGTVGVGTINANAKFDNLAIT